MKNGLISLLFLILAPLLAPPLAAQDFGVDLVRFGNFIQQKTETQGGIALTGSTIRGLLREFGTDPGRIAGASDAQLVDMAIRSLERIRPIKVARGPGERGLNTDKLEQAIKVYMRDIAQPLTTPVIRGMLIEAGMTQEDAISLTDDEALYLVQRYLNPGAGPTTREMGILTALERQYQGFLRGHAPGLVEPQKSTVGFFDENHRFSRDNPKPLCLGTAIGRELVLTKASEVEGISRLQCEHNGRIAWGDIVHRFGEHDLAIVKVRGLNLRPVKWFAGVFPDVGTFIAAPSHDSDEPVGIGLVAVAPRSFSHKHKGWLGVALENKNGQVGVAMVVPDSPAARAGILQGDTLTHIDGRRILSVQDMIRTVGAKRPNDRVRFERISAGVIKTDNIVLHHRPEEKPAPRLVDGAAMDVDGEVSRVRKGFPTVFQTDLPILPREIGSPVVDLRGNVLGITIARSGRIETYAIPADTIRELLQSVDLRQWR